MGAQGTVRDHARACPLPEIVSILDSLRILQVDRQQLAVVVNGFGGSEGIVTMEDRIEELVGEIFDEADREMATVRRETDGSLRLPGGFPGHDLGDMGIDLPQGDYTTLAGLVLDRLGHIPAPGESSSVGSRTPTQRQPWKDRGSGDL